MLGKTRTSDTNLIGQRCPCTPHPAFSQRISWPRRAQKVWEGPESVESKELVFVSFKKGFDKDISPATISSWIKQTVILCYELSDQESHTLHQVKAHDVRAFAASKAFQSGVSLEQILSACHWKSHNTFTQFYFYFTKSFSFASCGRFYVLWD